MVARASGERVRGLGAALARQLLGHQEEAADARLELASVGARHRVAAFHRAPARRQRAARGVLEALARLEQRLLADHTRAAHVLAVVVGVDDDPVPLAKLRGLLAFVADRDRVGEAVLARVRIGDRKSTRLNSSHSQISYA